MIQEQIKNLIKESLKNFKIEAKDILLEHPVDLSMGDYSTNVAMVYAKELKTNPKELAEKTILELNKNLTKEISKIEQKNGFINFYLSREFFAENTKKILEQKENFGKNKKFIDKKIMIEYTQPNPFKPFHIGHLMSNAIGESLSRLFESSGANVIRANYQGDIGLHVAKAIYGLFKFGLPDDTKTVEEQAEYIGGCYSKSSSLYDIDTMIKNQIDEINKKIYARSDKKINEVYSWGRGITLSAFEEIYKVLGTKFDKYFFESEMIKIGKKIVKKNTPKIFEKSDGAIVFHAERYDPKLHTRVFISSQGLPTYETKEIGLTMTKFKSILFSKKLDLSVVITAVEQAEYMKVVQKAVSIMYPDLEKRMKHITHGMMRFATSKMSSRTGNVITGESLIKNSRAEIEQKIKDRNFTNEEKKEISEIVGMAALKYSILKQAVGGDIIFDFEKSISFDGDSGPYLQYSYTRAKSVLEKAKNESIGFPILDPKNPKQLDFSLPGNWESTDLEKILYKFPEVVLYSIGSLEPHHIASYLIDLARAFNAYYGNTKIVDKDDLASPYKVALTEGFSIVMKNGLWLLGIKVPEKM